MWAAWLGGERRASAHTIAAYGRDLVGFLDFLTEHLGETPGLASLTALRPADFRAYLARRAANDLERASLARAVGPPLAGTLFDQGARRPYVLASTLMVLVAALLLRTRPRRTAA